MSLFRSQGKLAIRQRTQVKVTASRQRRRQSVLEPLESRTLLAYAFAYNPVTQVATATGDASVDSLVLEPLGGFLMYSVNGGAFSGNWGGSSVPVDPLLTVDVTLSTGNGSSLTLGTPTGPASTFGGALLNAVAPSNTSDTMTFDDSQGTTLASGALPYSIDTQFGNISGPGFNYSQAASQPFTGGVTVMGSPVNGNIYNVLSSCCQVAPGQEPVTIETAASTTSTVNVGNGGTLGSISSPVAILGSGGATININDASDTTHGTATLDNLSGNPSAPYEVKGLSAFPIEYGAGVTALNINGGTDGAAGVTYNVNNTQAGTTTTINGGSHENFYNLADSTSILDNLPGPVAINGGSSGADEVSVNDSASLANDNYTVTNTTVASTGLFGGLTYGGLAPTGTLSLYASQGSNVIDVNSTANGVNTRVYGEQGTDTINVNGTGTGAALAVITGNATAQASTVNVLANSEAVNISSNATSPTITTVNVGSTGGPGSMAGIQGPISVVNSSSLASLSFHDENDASTQTWTLNNSDGTSTGSVAVTGSATTTYNPIDLSSLTVNGGSGGNTFNVNATSGFYPTTLNTGTGADTVNVFATGNNTLNIHGQGGQDTLTLGGSGVAPLGMQGLNGTINVDNATSFTTLILDDSLDSAGRTAFLTNDGTTVTGLSPATINYTDANIATLTVDGSNAGGNTFNVDNTFANLFTVPTVTTIDKGTGGSSTVNVHGTAAGSALDITGGAGTATDTVDIGAGGSVANILGKVNVQEVPGSTNLILNLTNDGLSHNFVLSSDGTTSTLHDTLGNLPDFTYITASLASLTIDTDPAFAETLNIDLGEGGNPIPTASLSLALRLSQGGSSSPNVSVNTAGLIFNADGDGSNPATPAGTHALNIYGELPTGPFASETHNANDQTVFPQVGQYGSIYFTDAASTPNLTGLDYTGLQPITDTAPAVNYTFNDLGYPDQSFSAATGPVISGFQTLEFTNTPTPPTPLNFETTDVANKTNIVFNTPPLVAGTAGPGVNGVVNIPTPSVGLLSLTFNTNNIGDNNVSFVNTPPGVATSLNGGSEEDVTNVTGLGVAAGTVLFLDGGAAANTLNYNAGGLTPTITPGLLPGEVRILIPGAGVVDAINYQQINITNIAPIAITPGPAVSINSVEGFQLVNQIVGTFTAPIPGLAGLPASAFTASIDWGDPSPDAAAGTITQDASNPSVYYITGTHTFASNGTYTVANTVAFAGGTFTAPVNGVPISVTFGPSGPTAGTPATATVTQGPLAVTAFPVIGTEGVAIAAGPIATFIDAGGASPAASYSATITVTNSAGAAVVSVPAASVTQNGNAAQYTVNAPAFTLPEEGTYQVVVSVTDSAGATPLTVAGASTAVIGDAALTAGTITTTPATVNTGVPFTATGTFTDANPTAPTSDFTATIDWGDGSPNSVGTITQPGGVGTTFDVGGSHTYAKPGTYAVTTVVVDAGGQKTTLSATFTIADLPVISFPGVRGYTAVEGQDTGTIVLATFEDPNTLATVANVTASLPANGWGDGTPGSPTPPGSLAVVQIGVDPANGDPIFQVLGSHKYADEGAFAVNINVTTSGGVTTALTPGTATVLDAPLTSSNGTVITGIEGATTGAVLLGSFIDANQGATNADFTTAPGSAVVNWGDGSAPQTLTAANVTASGSPDGVVFSITASHTYAETGTYAYSVTVTDDGGSVTIFSGSAVIADAALAGSATQPTITTTEAAVYPVPVFAPPLFKGPVASFTDGNPTAPLGDFTATIDWGDGTPATAGTVSQPGGVGTAFVVGGSHTYADSGVNGGTGTYSIQVFIVDMDGKRLTVANTAHVADNPIVLTGSLNPASDSGLSTGTPNVTNVNQPNFFGKSEPLSTVTLSAALLPSGTPFIIGHVEAGSDGSWSVTANAPLADGHYTITAAAVDQFGVTTTTSPAVITSSLLIDTAGPKIAGMFFNRLNGQVDYIIKDPVNPDGSAPSGVWVNTLLDSSNYLLTKVHANKAYPGKYVVTNVTATADPTIPYAYDVAVTFDGGAILKGGYYLFTIRDSSNGNSSVQDLAENHLDGVFYGSFPSGNGINGSDFVAELQAVHNKVFAPQTIIGTAFAGNGGVGGPRVAPIHSGIFVPAIPVGGSPIFSTTTSPSNGADPPAKTTKKPRAGVVLKTKPIKVTLPKKNLLHGKTTTVKVSPPMNMTQWNSIRSRMLNIAATARGGR